MSTTVPGNRGPQRREKENEASVPDSAVAVFVREHGWRAYVIPVLAVITVWLLIDAFTSPTGELTTGGGADTAVDSPAREVEEPPFGPGPDPSRSDGTAVAPTELPPGGAFAQSGEGSFRTVGAPGAAAGAGEELVIRYVLEIENGVDAASYGGDDAFASLVDATLADPRGWVHDPRFRFEHVDPDADPNLRIRLASVDTTHEFCGNDLEMETSCRTTVTGENLVMLNDSRWTRGAETFEGDLGSYRQYLINHEVGHALGYQRHVACGGEGALAPIMMQQTLSLTNSQLNAFNPEEIYPDDDATCRYNAWPYPELGDLPGAADGPEAPPADARVGEAEETR